MYFLFDEIGLIIVIAGCFFGGFLPLLIMIMICPEAREHIKCRITGGVIVEKFYDTGQCEYVVAKRKGGEGQYIAGKNAFGQREIYVKPREPAHFLNKPFLLSGMRRLKFFAYGGKTPIVNHETLMAINTVEAPDKPLGLPAPFIDWANEKHPSLIKEFNDAANNGGSDLREKVLPPDVMEWAKNNGIHIEEPVYEEVEIPNIEEGKNGVKKTVGTKKVLAQTGSKERYFNLIDLDPRKLKNYYSDHYDESQIDNLLEQSRIEGIQEGREGKRFHFGLLAKVGIAFIVIAIVGVVLMLALQGAGA